MKKILLIGLVLLLAASLAACAGGKTDGAKLLTEVKTTQFSRRKKSPPRT